MPDAVEPGSRPADSAAKVGIKAANWTSWFVSVSLVVVTLFLAACCIFLLSSVLTQGRLSAITIDGVGLSIRKLVAVGDQWATTREQIEKEIKQRNDARSKRIDLNERATNAQNELAAKKENLEQMLVTLHSRVDATEPPIAAVNGKGYANQIGAIQEWQPHLHTDHPELDAYVGDVMKAYADYTSAERARDAARAILQAAEQSIKDISDNIDNDTKSLNSFFELIKIGIDAPSREKVDTALYELFFNHQFTTRVSNSLMTMQPDNLTLWLVISMGILGSALQITHAYCVRNQVITFSAYFLRLSLGAITALVMFIVAKAGVPVIADASRLGGDAPINPYFVAFLAIISGLLSENALANVQEQGMRFLGQGPAGPDRWARRDLTPDLQAAGLSVANLAAYLGTDEETTATMLKGEQKMDADTQKLVAIYLRADPRDLFTDIPPPKK
jgi:hypothetical protein